jgi:stage II sporulation protein AA (anti-sigma F factor antagonist)
MNLKTQMDGEELTAFISGDIDHHNAVMLREKVDRQIAQLRPRSLVIDLSGVEFMDSSGLGFIMGRYRTMASRGGRVAVQGDTGRVAKILGMSGAYKYVEHREEIK